MAQAAWITTTDAASDIKSKFFMDGARGIDYYYRRCKRHIHPVTTPAKQLVSCHDFPD